MLSFQGHELVTNLCSLQGCGRDEENVQIVQLRVSVKDTGTLSNHGRCGVWGEGGSSCPAALLLSHL